MLSALRTYIFYSPRPYRVVSRLASVITVSEKLKYLLESRPKHLLIFYFFRTRKSTTMNKPLNTSRPARRNVRSYTYSFSDRGGGETRSVETSMNAVRAFVPFYVLKFLFSSGLPFSVPTTVQVDEKLSYGATPLNVNLMRTNKYVQRQNRNYPTSKRSDLH